MTNVKKLGPEQYQHVLALWIEWQIIEKYGKRKQTTILADIWQTIHAAKILSGIRLKWEQRKKEGTQGQWANLGHIWMLARRFGETPLYILREVEHFYKSGGYEKYKKEKEGKKEKLVPHKEAIDLAKFRQKK